MKNENTISSPNFTPAGTPAGNVSVLNKIIKWCIYIFIFLLPLWFLPFTGDVLGLNKQFLMVVVLTVALIAWLGKLLSQDKINWYKGLIAFLFLSFVIVYVLAAVFSIVPYDSLMGIDDHLSRALINVIYFFVFFLLIVNYAAEHKNEKRAQIMKFLLVFLTSSALVGLIGLFQILGQFLFNWDFAQATSFNTVGTLTSLGIFMSVVLVLGLSLLFSFKKFSFGGLFLSILSGLCFVIILLLNLQIVWIITAVGMLIISGFWLAQRHKLNLAWAALPTAILALCLVLIVFRPVLFDLNLPSEVGLTQSSGLNIAKKTIQGSPVLGTGPETFVYDYSLYKPESINQTVFWNLRFRSGPSEIISLLAETGILGLLAFLGLAIVFLFQAIKNLVTLDENSEQLREIKIGLFAGWFALLVSWFFYPQNIVLLFLFWLIMTLFVALSIQQEKDVKEIDLKSSGKIALISSFGFIILMVIVVGFLYLGGSKFLAEAKYQKGIELINEGKLDAGIDKAVQATVTNSYEDKFYRNLSQLFLVKLDQDINNPDLDEQTRSNRIQTGVANATNSALRATNLNPKNVTNWIVRGSVYRNLMNLVDGAGDWAIKAYEQALTLEPGSPFIYVEIARAYTAQNDLDKAAEAYDKAIKIKQNYSLAHFEIALVYDAQGKTKEAIAKMENSLRAVPSDTGILFQLGVLYYKDSQFDRAKLAFANTINLNPNFSNARYFLGLLFDREGNKNEAIAQFEKIAELNPGNELIMQILDNLRAGKPALGSPELGPPEQPEEIPIEEQAEEWSPGLPTSE